MDMFDRKNIKRYYLIFVRQIRNFLLSTKSREFLIFLFFVFVGIGKNFEKAFFVFLVPSDNE